MTKARSHALRRGFDLSVAGFGDDLVTRLADAAGAWSNGCTEVQRGNSDFRSGHALPFRVERR